MPSHFFCTLLSCSNSSMFLPSTIIHLKCYTVFPKSCFWFFLYHHSLKCNMQLVPYHMVYKTNSYFLIYILHFLFTIKATLCVLCKYSSMPPSISIFIHILYIVAFHFFLVSEIHIICFIFFYSFTHNIC